MQIGRQGLVGQPRCGKTIIGTVYKDKSTEARNAVCHNQLKDK